MGSSRSSVRAALSQGMVPRCTPEDTVLFAKNTSGGKPEGTTHCGRVMNLRDQKNNGSCECDPSPRGKRYVFADRFTKVINGFMQEEHRETEKETKNGHATQRNTYPHDVGSTHSLADEEAKDAIDEVKHTPQLLGRRITRPKVIEKCRRRTGIREHKGGQSDQATPDHPAKALIVLWWEVILARQ